MYTLRKAKVPGPWSSIKMSSYQYRNSHCGDKTVLRPSYLHNGFLSGVLDFFDRNKILSGSDLSHYQVPHCIRVFFYFVWFVFIHHNFQFYFELCTYCNILDIYLS